MVKKRYLFLILGTLVLALLLALGSACYWLTATAQGSAWLVRTLAGLAPETVSVRAVEGRLIDQLVLEDVELRWDGGKAMVKRITGRWRAGDLMSTGIRIRALTIEDVALATDAARQETTPPAALDWPEPPGWLRFAIDDLQIRRLTWQRPDASPVYLEGLATRVRWTGRRLRLPFLTALGDAGALSARANLDWKRMRLQLQAAALVKNGLEEALPLALALDMQPAEAREIMRGTLRASTCPQTVGGLQLIAPYRLSASDLQLIDWRLRPGSGPGTLQGETRIAWAGEALRIDLGATLDRWDLAPLTGTATSLAGRLNLSGSPQAYTGRLSLSNAGATWRRLGIETDLAGDLRQLHLEPFKATALEGNLDGALTLQWDPQLHIRGTLNGQGLNPQAAGLAWPGDINLQAEGRYERSAQGDAGAALRATLLPSTLRGHPLQGRLAAGLEGQALTIEALELRGRGLDLSAHGQLHKRLAFAAAVEDLAGLLPGTGGTVQGQGWLRWRNDRLAGRIDGSGRNLHRDQLHVQRLRFDAELGENRALSFDAQLSGLERGTLQIPALALQADGTLARHKLALRATLPQQARLTLAAAGGYQAARWQGSLTDLTFGDVAGSLQLEAPVPLALSRRELRLDPLQLTGPTGERLETRAQIDFTPLRGTAELRWQALRLAHAQPWLDGAVLTGSSDGQGAWRQSGKGDFAISGQLRGTGRLSKDKLHLDMASTAAALRWNPEGLRAELSADFKDGGKLQGHLEGGPSDRPALPERGTWALNLSDLKLQHLNPWLPTDYRTLGVLSARGQGQFLPGGALQASGSLTVRDGQLHTGREQGQVTVPVQQAEMSWDWREQLLSGQAELQLGDYGQLQGTFRLPVPARLPVRPEPEGALQITLRGRSAELGLLTALMPGAVQESRGRVDLDLQGDGTWRQPRLSGRARLLEAGAYLPVAGIELQQVGFEVRLEDDRLLLEDLSLHSGKGTLQGSGSLQLRDWRLGDYRLTLQGQGVQVINLPELQVTASPDLSLTGTPDGVKVSGSILLPEVLVRDIEKPSVVAPSEDVVIIGRKEPEKTASGFRIEADVRLLLGDHVLIQTDGLDARLSGDLRLTAIGADSLNAEGRISVAEGQYAAYGTRLDITRGNLLFNGPLDQPTLDILALRTVGKVKAGVQVSGTPRTPVVQLTSEPAMSDSDRLAYIVLGRASASNAGEADLLMAAGGALLSQGESVVLRDRLKRQLGIDVLGFEAGDGSDDVTGSMLTVGKYLSPSLYVSIGQSLFSDTQQFRLRYSLSNRWELESTTGEESGVDLYYKIEFR